MRQPLADDGEAVFEFDLIVHISTRFLLDCNRCRVQISF